MVFAIEEQATASAHQHESEQLPVGRRLAEHRRLQSSILNVKYAAFFAGRVALEKNELISGVYTIAPLIVARFFSGRVRGDFLGVEFGQVLGLLTKFYLFVCLPNLF